MDANIKISIKNLSFRYYRRNVIDNLSFRFAENKITAITGPSGQGKSTLLTTINRLWEDIPGACMTGNVTIQFKEAVKNIYDRSIDLPWLRKKVGMVFQSPNPLPMSIFKNTAFPLKLAGEKDNRVTASKVENALKKTFLWNEVKDRLQNDARTLSGGQQQRLCMARALVLEPEVLLLDEPTSSLDPLSVSVIENLLLDLKHNQTIIMVSHYLDQIKRIADHVMELE
ncbi:MAG: phosphate ABC transporter ATP-binding protein [Proteobacteria bacterium]|nr:phosphate ABC transporter ATP-binding protein [Pseudomonadota bacterium]